MKEITSRFGKGVLHSIGDFPLGSKVFVTSAACMSITSDWLSVITANQTLGQYDRVKFVHSAEEASIMVVLGCQVTDLAVLNDVRLMEDLHEKYPDKSVFVGGCLAYRFDIKLPDFVKRIEVHRVKGIELTSESEETLVWQKPFWVKGDLGEEELSNGRLFRDMYMLKIGAGCNGKCKYCTIRDTRGGNYEMEAADQVDEFLNHADKEGVVLVSDSPTVKQIKDWCGIAKQHGKAISFRNVEPPVTLACKEELLDLARAGLLKIYHCPIQSNNPELLAVMNRSASATLDAISVMDELREAETKVATNIIIDYVAGRKEYRNMDTDWLNEHFDYWSWNPYFDGNWNRSKAEQRFEKYLGKQTLSFSSGSDAFHALLL